MPRTTSSPTVRRSAASSLALAAGLAFAVPAPPAGAQEAAPPAAAEPGREPGEVFFEQLDVHVVDVDVYVTDSDGRPVTGLTVDDFELFEDGRPVEITNFYAVAGSRPRTPAPAEEPPRVAAEAGAPPRAEPPAPAVPEDQRLHLIVFVDNLHISPFSRNRVVRELQAALHDLLGPEDRAMLVTFERSVSVRQPFTSDPRLIDRALDGIETLSALAVQRNRERADLLDTLDSARDPLQIQGDVDFYAKSAHDDLLRSIDALKQLVGSLGGLPGRKALLYVSDGIPLTPGEDLFFLLDQRGSNAVISSQIQAARYRTQRDFVELSAQASASRVTFYTLDARGLVSHSSLSAEHRGSASSTSNLEADVLHDANLAAPLQLMAEETGGLATFNTNNVRGALERMARDFDTYYSLGYSPAHHGDGRYYELEVRVKGRRGLTVRHRGGYRDKTLEARVTDATLGALLYGGGGNDLGLRLEVGAGQPQQGRRHLLVPLKVWIPLSKVTFLPRGTVYEGRLRVAVAVSDGDGALSTPTQMEVPVVVPAAELDRAREQSFVYEASLMMLPGRQRLAVGVRDDVSGEASYLREPVVVGR